MRAREIKNLLLSCREWRSTTEIAQAMKLSPKTTRRKMNELVEDGWAHVQTQPGEQNRYIVNRTLLALLFKGDV